ncbi:MAG: rod shape-determining protein [Clostridia bacterium]|nr:rod shape-determining protein [Clostridia bacterium]
MARDIGIDLGTSSVLIYLKGKGIILDEPSVVALDTETGAIRKIGREAEAMIGRTPPHISTVRPMRDGVISQYDMTLKMLQYFLRRAGGAMTYRPRLVICVPSGITEVEERALVDAATQAGASKTYLLEEPIAAAMGVGIDIDAPRGCMVVDIGGGTTDIAVISMGGIVVSDSIKVGGDKYDDAIIRYMRRKHNLYIGDRTAEEVKLRIGSIWNGDEKDNANERTMEVRGRCLVTGLPKGVTVTSREIADALDEAAGQIEDAVCKVVEKIPTELLGDIAAQGILFTGGASLVFGTDRRMAKTTGLRCRIAENPRQCVANGIGRALGNLAEMQDGTQGVGARQQKRNARNG